MGLSAAQQRAVLLVSLSLGLTLALGFGLPQVLKLLFRFLGFPCDNVSHCIVLLYFVLVLCVALPAVPRGSVPIQGKEVLITGCDSGFGLALAKHLHKLGFTVFAGCLLKDKNGDGAQELESMQSDRLRVLQMNVCNEEEVSRALEFVKRHLRDPEHGLWGVVNNAGIATYGDVEFTGLDTYKKVADVNLWGTIRVTKVFLPLVRRAKGRVVCMVSMLGRMGSPSRSSYCVSKYGVEAFCDCLRQEMYHWGVKVIAIEPGNFIAATNIFTKDGVEKQAEEMWEKASDVVQEDYGKPYFIQQVARMKSFVSSGSKNMSSVINAITDALSSKYPYTRYNPSETYWWIKVQIMTHLPTAIADRIYIR
ncbi:D-beta-hydroxybutyrate dehydrogenase, mitochondrial-like [Pelobates cultripes]|uniref:D-beta-hydroxybutyrate dehydrogenase, mitochondrial-like n=1 Tax=Pelobates cultripes TaxID=61616 RepID=A0AAD1RBZ2_PELCU|nr:D-beta-hydroxybutyrate dehydrogenase, mitochondrial-like [Pelobates cultripes]